MGDLCYTIIAAGTYLNVVRVNERETEISQAPGVDLHEEALGLWASGGGGCSFFAVAFDEA
jgi:hypothetical protein